MFSRIKLITLVAAISFGIAACDDHPDPDDQAVVEHEVQTPLQKTYDSLDECKQEFSTDGDCTTTTVIVDNQPHTVFISPFFYPWGAIYHPGGYYSYGHSVPSVTSRVVSSSLPASAPKPNYSNSASYAATRSSALSTARASSGGTRGGFGGTARGFGGASSSGG